MRQLVGLGQCIANAAAERIDQVFFRMAIGREVDSLFGLLGSLVHDRLSDAVFLSPFLGGACPGSRAL
jgi:hypothetical protein